VRARRMEVHGGTSKFDLTLHTAPHPDGLRATLEYSTDLFERGTAKFDLDLGVHDDGERLFGFVEYRADLFDGATAERMMAHLALLLERAAEAPDQPLSRIPLGSGEERARVVHAWNDTARPYAGRTLPDLFRAQAARTPDADAVVFGGGRLSYAELDRRSDALAARLVRMGVGPDAAVGICAERSLEMAVGVLAILKAGGAYVPLDPAHPADRLAYMLRDARVRVLAAHDSLAPLFAGEPVQVVSLDPVDGDSADARRPVDGDSGDARRLIDRDPGDAPRSVDGDSADATVSIDGTISIDGDAAGGDAAGVPRSIAIDPDHLAYVIYTSGSTGRPKGVCLPHRALVNLIEWHLEELLPAARTLQFASLGFDASFHEMFAAWASGGPVVMITPGEQKDVAALADVLEREGVEKAILPVTVLQYLAEEQRGREGRFAALREVTATGEQLHVTPAVTRFFGSLPHASLHNHYGPSETHVVTAHALPGDPARWPSHPPIGRPISNTRIYLLDPAGSPVPVGVPGELFVGGDSLARGYLGRPGLTAEKFVPDPFSGEPGARLYTTGDLSRWRADGEIEYLGRIDQQVKIRGFRIEPGEVESVLAAHPRVRECVVLVRAEGGEKRLVAYVTAEGDAPSSTELRAHLRTRLPDYMVPSAFVALDALPLNANGKVDRRALPAPEREDGSGYVAPRTATEEILAGIWAEVLRKERVGTADDFFALGGHSLLATRLVSRARPALGVELPLRAVFEHPTVAALAAEVDALRRGGARALPPIVRVPRGGALPLSFAQQRMWFIDQLHPGSAAYHIPAALRLTGALDTAALRRALDEVVRRHEVLRTTFRTEDGEAVQVIAPPAPVPFPEIDLRGVEIEKRERMLLRLAAEEAMRPFDLAAGPLLRATLVRLGEE
ncbi:MAG TPA: amino acid adenylation domain-containing protein, partial [Longimicrobium sp.]|nr:amino acid adenylation domain-containing protein [Longimicrobium sp.]